MTDLAIDVHGLTKKFGRRTVVNALDLQVPRGKVFGFLGPNGSGKTTTMRMLCGLLTPDAGQGKCLGLDIASQSNAIRSKVGYMTQKFSFWEDLTIRENLEFTASVYGMDDVNRRVDEALEKLGLTTRAKQLAGTLSGGWKQRLALAACTIHNPEILLLDEPTAGVDPKARREFWDEIHRLSETGITVLVSTHYMDEAERCHEIVYIAYGNVMVKGAVPFVIESAGVKTFGVRGTDLPKLKEALSSNPDVLTSAVFGDVLHVCCAKEKSPAFPNGVSVSEIPTSLEDAFIYYMMKAKEN